MPHQVFVSHATEDREVASRVCTLLEDDGISCWIAPRNVKAGTDYATAILDAIRTCDLMLLIFSERADGSPYVLREVERAVAYKRPVLALRIDATAPSSSMEYYVHVWRPLDASTGIDSKQHQIIAAVRQRLPSATKPVGWHRVLHPHTWSRRTWAIALAAVVVIAAGLGLGLGLTRDREDTGTVTIRGRVAWKELEPSEPLPAERYGHVLVHDPTSGRLLMFGGYAGKDGGAALNDLWAYVPTADSWIELTPSGALPSGRTAASMVYDPSTRMMIMYGGNTGTARLGDLWAYDPAANAWTELHPSGEVPAGRAGHVMAYDSTSGRMIMFGGRAGESDFLSDTWAYDPAANAWTESSPSAISPAARAVSAMVYDPGARRMMLFGGWNMETDLGDTWAYDPDADAWTELDIMGTAPAARSGADLVHDTATGQVIMFGGFATSATGTPRVFRETWAFEAATNMWTRFAVSSGVTPALRVYSSVVYDPSGNRLIVFGGSTGLRTDDSDLNDIWAGTLSSR